MPATTDTPANIACTDYGWLNELKLFSLPCAGPDQTRTTMAITHLAI